MGNLICFKYGHRNRKSKWFDEWQNNSSYQNQYNYCDRNYCDRMNEANFPIEQDLMNNYFSNNSYQNSNYPGYSAEAIDPSQYNEESNNYNVQMQQYYNGNPYGRDQNASNENYNSHCDTNRGMQDNVQEAFMSDWFIKEEAELNCNVKTLENGENSQSNEESNCEEAKKKVIPCKKELKVELDNESADNSSDSDMRTIDCLAKSENKQGASMGFSTKKNAKCCYTAYIMCNNSVEWENFLKRSARMMTGLQRQFSCIIKFSDKISFHRGNSVRTFQIIGSHKGNVIRCKAALPKMVTKMLITSMTCSAEVEEYSRECNRDTRSTLNRRMKGLDSNNF